MSYKSLSVVTRARSFQGEGPEIDSVIGTTNYQSNNGHARALSLTGRSPVNAAGIDMRGVGVVAQRGGVQLGEGPQKDLQRAYAR